MARARDSAHLVERHFGNWEMAFDALKNLNKANLEIMAARSVALAGKVSAFVATSGSGCVKRQ